MYGKVRKLHRECSKYFSWLPFCIELFCTMSAWQFISKWWPQKLYVLWTWFLLLKCTSIHHSMLCFSMQVFVTQTMFTLLSSGRPVGNHLSIHALWESQLKPGFDFGADIECLHYRLWGVFDRFLTTKSCRASLKWLRAVFHVCSGFGVWLIHYMLCCVHGPYIVVISTLVNGEAMLLQDN